MASVVNNIDIGWKTRMCMVNDEIGYFHTWEYTPNKVTGIVEFSRYVRRVDPEDIHFCDDENLALHSINRKIKESKDEQKVD